MQKTFIIAEAGVNHNGSLVLAKQLVEKAKEAGADAVKFQTFKSEQLVSGNSKKADYQIANTGTSESQLEMIKKLELSFPEFVELKHYAEKCEIEFMSAPFDLESANFLIKELKLRKIKIPSGEITNALYLYRIAQTGAEVILSTGMSNLIEIENALGVLAFGYLNTYRRPCKEEFQSAFQSPEGKSLLAKKVILLHCTSSYPTPFEDVNLRALAVLKEKFGLPVGYSDHTLGLAAPLAAVALGSCVVEKHFTLDKKMKGPDHVASLDPQELKDMVTLIRQTEISLGNAAKGMAPSEANVRDVARKSLFASQPIIKGEVFSESNLTSKRPGQGVSAMEYFDVIGCKATRDYQVEEPIQL